MNTNSNSYTIIYASVMVVIVAFLLAFVSSALKPTQDKNIEMDKKKQILAALNVRDKSMNVEEMYDKYVIADIIVRADGSVVNEGKDKDRAGFKVENKNIDDNTLPVYICKVNDAVKYVIPMTGRGLWGGLWGYMAVNDDFATVYGAYFSHESETAGLGALIAEEKFQDLFKGKSIFSDASAEEVALTVVKHGQVEPDKQNCQVDGLTGATLTSVGVADMVNKGLGKYTGFFKANKK